MNLICPPLFIDRKIKDEKGEIICSRVHKKLVSESLGLLGRPNIKGYRYVDFGGRLFELKPWFCHPLAICP